MAGREEGRSFLWVKRQVRIMFVSVVSLWGPPPSRELVRRLHAGSEAIEEDVLR
jgi:hypothetical protein